MKILLSLLLLFASLLAYKIENSDGDTIFFIGGKDNNRISINCGDEIDEDYALKVCGKILADDFVKDEITIDFKDSDDTLDGDEEDSDHKIKVTLELNKKAKEDVTFHFETKDDEAEDGKDYDKVDDDFTISAGDTSIDIEINIYGDSTEENDEKFNIEITNVKNATASDSTADYTIKNDDTTPDVSIVSSKTITETNGDQTIQLRVSLSESLSSDATFDLKTADGSGDDGALDGEDYTKIDDSFTIVAGDDYIDIDLTIKGDDLYEYSDKFTAKISNASSNVNIDNDTCDLAIDNDDSKPEVNVKEDKSENEDVDPLFRVEMSKASGVPTIVHIKMGHTDTEDADFENSSPIDADFTIDKGDDYIDIKVDVKDDDSDEDDEDYTFKITDATNADIGSDDEKKGTIVDNDSSSMFSDRRLKTDIRKIKTSLQDIEQLNGVKFYWKNKKRFGEQEEVGVIAQDIEKVYPQLIVTNKEGYKKVKYQFLVAPLIEAVKELKKENEALSKRIKALEDEK